MRTLLVALGVLVAVGLAIGLARSSSAITKLIDPVGDTFGVGGVVQLDISSIDAEFDDTNLTVTVEFYTPIQPTSAKASNSVLGFIFLDTDQDIDTGVLIGDALGAEFVVDLLLDAPPGQTIVRNIDSGIAAGNAAITFADDAFTVTIPLTTIGHDDGLVGYDVLIGAPESGDSEYFFFTDEAPNDGMDTSERAPVTFTLTPISITTPTPTPTAVLEVTELPTAGGQPPGSSPLPLLYILAGTTAIVVVTATARRWFWLTNPTRIIATRSDRDADWTWGSEPRT